MLPRQEWCGCVSGYTMHDVVDSNGETMVLKCRLCSKRHRTATAAQEEAQVENED